METVKAPGLKYRKLADRKVPIWVADENDVRNGYTPKTANLGYLADSPDILIAKCHSLQADMLLWRTGYRGDRLAFDGTIRALLRVYECHENSPFRSLKPATRTPYIHYLSRLTGHIGDMQVDEISGIHLVKWHTVWSSEGHHLAAAAMARAVLEAALSFGVMLRLPGCAALAAICRETRKRLPRPQPRSMTATVEQVEAARRAAHANGRPSSALAYALAFESTLRLWDVIGQWYPIEWPAFSSVLDAGANAKWIGLCWEHIDENMMLSYTPSKTDRKSGVSISYPLSKAPMVIQELEHWPIEKRKGPVIRSEESGLPYRSTIFAQRWTVDRKTAGLPSTLWARDLRASGITEGRESDVSTDDAGKVAGHTSSRLTSKVYDRAVIAAANRFADARVKGRERSGNGGGNER